MFDLNELDKVFVSSERDNEDKWFLFLFFIKFFKYLNDIVLILVNGVREKLKESIWKEIEEKYIIKIELVYLLKNE